MDANPEAGDVVGDVGVLRRRKAQPDRGVPSVVQLAVERVNRLADELERATQDTRAQRYPEDQVQGERRAGS